MCQKARAKADNKAKAAAPPAATKAMTLKTKAAAKAPRRPRQRLVSLLPVLSLLLQWQRLHVSLLPQWLCLLLLLCHCEQWRSFGSACFSQHAGREACCCAQARQGTAADPRGGHR